MFTFTAGDTWWKLLVNGKLCLYLFAISPGLKHMETSKIIFHL